ncbi:MAG: hypothetical protein FJ117_11860 [Deltaproteobacteria bacterium]|nr:hypothetical protein [Deltaproteobacteria bacterium]
MRLSVIPAKAGIQLFQIVINYLDSGFHLSARHRQAGVTTFYDSINYEYLYSLHLTPYGLTLWGISSAVRLMKYRSIHEINHLAPEERAKVYRSLIPPSVFTIFGIDRNNLANRRGEKVVQFHTPESHGFASIDVKQKPDDLDSIFFLQISDTPFMDNLELSFVVINDPRGERFSIDRDEEGKDTLFGTALRNEKEEKRAMMAGLAPGQVRPGLRLLREFINVLERFASRLSISIISGEALFYHNAIQYERFGFGYLEGRKRMEEIDREFLVGGKLYERLDGLTPFRPKGADRSVRGRSWAIQDGILGEPWLSPKIYKPVGKSVGVNTFHGKDY